MKIIVKNTSSTEHGKFKLKALTDDALIVPLEGAVVEVDGEYQVCLSPRLVAVNSDVAVQPNTAWIDFITAVNNSLRT